MLLVCYIPNKRSLGPGSTVEEKGKKRGQLGKVLAIASPSQTTSHVDFFSFFAQCGAWFQATIKATVEALVSSHPRDGGYPRIAKKVSVTGAGCLGKCH